MIYDRIVSAAVGRVRYAWAIGLDTEELRAIGQLAALEAERSWRSDGGAAMDTWVWTCVRGAVKKAVYRATREIADDTAAEVLEDGEPGPEITAIIRQGMTLLRAQLDPDEFRILWAVHALGFTPSELADLRRVSSVVIRQRLSRARRKSVTILRLAA